ncbi:MAG: PEP/pyruvate-binding domain-containing protein [Candidatus Hodarchaeales archaeon]
MTLNGQEESYLVYKPKYLVFHELMEKRINRVLLVASHYDSFILEEDGQLSDQIFEQFHNLNLRTRPRIKSVTSTDEALKLIESEPFDLVITMRRLGDIDPFSFGQNVKKIANIPVILLIQSAADIHFLPASKEGVDRIFVWNGDSTVFVAIIKHLEDKMNLAKDTRIGNVRVIIVVEDSVRYRSLFLPLLYSEVMKQTHRLITEGVNDFHHLLQMRARPKIILTETFEEAIQIYNDYRKYIIGIISDISFPRNGAHDKHAGIFLIKKIRSENPTMPTVLQSSDITNRSKAEEIGAFFIHKNSIKLLNELREFMLRYLGFGDFVFRFPNGQQVGRAKNIIEFHEKLKTVPIESLVYHGKNDHFSGWLAARSEFSMATKLKPRKVSDFDNPEDLRRYLINSIDEILVEKTQGVINDFSLENYHPNIVFTRLRPGSLGGKGRGIAFLMYLLNSFRLKGEFPNVAIKIPKTVVIGTDEFDRFMEYNDLYDLALSDIPDEIIKEKFVTSGLSKELIEDLEFLLIEDLTGPLAVRSSSVLEDSQYQPYAGVFATYMIPNNYPSLNARLKELCTAIKLVYASTFLKQAKSYSETVGQTIEEAKMAVVIQKVVGKDLDGTFFPDYSGTALSYNFYPISYLKPEDRISFLAIGLGKTIVDGGYSFRFCPKYPDISFMTKEQLLKYSQKDFFAINMKEGQDLHGILSDEDHHLIKRSIFDIKDSDLLTNVADTYDYNDEVLKTGYWGEGGAPIVTFSHQLKLDTFPLPGLISKILTVGEKAMGCPVEIEFAGNFKRKDKKSNEFYLLQIRPIDEILGEIKEEDIIVSSSNVSGNRIIKDVTDIVYIIPEKFDKTKTREIASRGNQQH